MKFKKTIVSLLTATCLTAGIGASLLGQPADKIASAAAMDTEDEFMLGTWVAYHTRTEGPIDDYDEQTAELARSGMNYVPHPTWSQYNSTMNGRELYDKDNLSDWQEIDDIYGKYNMKYAVRIDANTSSRIEMGKQLTNANSYYVVDEPQDSTLGHWADIIKQAASEDGTRFPFINLLPSYAGSSALGGSLEYHAQHLIDLAGMENLEYLGLDHYNFADGGAEGSYSSSYFSDMEIQRRIAYNNGKMKTGGFSQTGTWNARRYPTINEVTWNVNTMLAYGYKMINHFCWVPPYNTDDGQLGEKFGAHVLDQYGNKTVLYEPMQKLNWQTRQLGQVMMDMDCMHAYHVGSSIPSGTESLPSDFIIQPDSATRSKSLILSEFISKDETETYVAITNNSINTVTSSFTLNEGITSLVRYDVDSFDTLPSDESIAAGTAVGAPTQVSVDTSSHSLSVTLAPGEIKLFKVEGSVTSTAIQDPVPSLNGGAYSSPQTLNFTTADNSTEVYYTLDGSYPTRATNLYTGTGITVGTAGQTGRVTVRYKAYKGKQETEVKEIDFFFTPNSSDIFRLSDQAIGWVWNDSTPNDTSDDWVNWSWGIENGVIKKHYPNGNWDTGLTWGNNTYHDFVLEGDFFINENNGEGSGFIGFGVNKQAVTDVESLNKGDLYVGLMANSTDNMRTFFWHNRSESYGPTSVNTGVNYAGSPTVNLRLVKIGDTVEFTVNGTQTYTATNANFNKTGYIGIVSSSFTIHVSNLTITSLDAANYTSCVPAIDYFLDDSTVVQPESTYVAANVTNPTGFVVDKGTAFSNIGLPTTTTVKDTAGNSYTVDVQWDESGYDANKEGAQVVTGTLVMPVQLANVNNTKLTADVLVRYTFDREPYRQIIADAKAYESDDYTVASYNYLQEQITMAEELVDDEWQWQSSVGVGTDVKIAGAIKGLVDISGLRSLVTEVSDLDLSGYTQGVEGVTAALSGATATLNKEDATAEEVATATDGLRLAKYGLKTAVTESFSIVGMSVRTGKPEGLRFVATMSGEMKSQYADGRFGMMILPADMDEQAMWTVSHDGTNYVTDNGALVIERGEWWSEELLAENSLTGAAYSCALIGSDEQFPADFYNRPITAVAFVIAEDGEIVYTGKVTRSIAYVATVESMKNTYVESEVVERVVAGTEITFTVGGDNKIAYNATATPVVTIGGMEATTSALVSVTYASSNTDVATVVDGKVKAVGTGTALITATVSVTNGQSFTKTLEVNCGSLDKYTPYFQQGFEGQTSFSHSDALNTGGSTTAIITSGAISQGSSLQFTTSSAAEGAGWNIMMLSHLGGTKANERYLVQMKVKVTAPASVTGGELRFRLRDGDSATEVEGLVIDVANHTVISKSDNETMCVYDEATGVYTVAVFMTADATNKKFNLTTVGGGSWTVTVDDVSYSNA